MSSADNQQERLKTGHFLAGFVEGEGSFNISIRRKADYKVSWQVVLSFNVSQRDPSLLYLLKQTLDCGIIKKRFDGVYSFDVTTPPLRSKDKIRNFNLFVKVANLMKNGEHKTQEGLFNILSIREKINLGKGRTRKYSIFDVFPNLSLESPETIRRLRQSPK